MHRGEGCLTVSVEARWRVCWDHERKDPTALCRVGSRWGGDSRDTKNTAESDCQQTRFSDHCYLPVAIKDGSVTRSSWSFPVKHALLFGVETLPLD